MFEELQKLSRHFLEIKNSPYRRYVIRREKFVHRISIVVGQRGVGKTTTLVQALLDFAGGDLHDPRILYIQADHFVMGNTSLYEVAERFQNFGGQWIVFDEIHKYPGWSQELKSIYDTFPKLKVIASGSSALEIYKGSHDLTRRASVHLMQGMSFREYLELECGIVLAALTLEEICQNHERLAAQIVRDLEKAGKKVLPMFQRYLKVGYYPYFHEIQEETVYQMTLEKHVHTTIESDLAAIYPQLTGASIQKIKQLLMFIAGAVPFTPNWKHIQSVLEIGDLRTLKSYFSHLEDAGLIRSLSKAGEKFNRLESPAKVYLENPNQLYAIASKQPEIGTVRETFFLNMVSAGYEARLPVHGDFQIGDCAFEIGGKNKGNHQFQAAPKGYKGYIVCDDIEQGARTKIPLWLFGFLY